MTTHVTPELIVSCLRLLADGYKLVRDRFKDKKTPENVEEIVIKIDKRHKGATTIDETEIDHMLTSTLNAEDAALVKSDLELLALLVFPSPALELFDYWGMLGILVTGLHKLAVDLRIFELRGVHGSLGEILKLDKTSKAILRKEELRRFGNPSPRWSLDDVQSFVVLLREGPGLLLRVVVEVTLEYYGGGGYGDTRRERCSGLFAIERGPKPHWLAFRRLDGNFELHENLHFMLTAAHFKAIVQALRDDIRDYATELKADEELIAPLFKQIDAFKKGIS
jgi:hypothetical protein